MAGTPGGVDCEVFRGFLKKCCFFVILLFHSFESPPAYRNKKYIQLFRKSLHSLAVNTASAFRDFNSEKKSEI
jgi:hypothetical protein